MESGSNLPSCHFKPVSLGCCLRREKDIQLYIYIYFFLNCLHSYLIIYWVRTNQFDSYFPHKCRFWFQKRDKNGFASPFQKDMWVHYVIHIDSHTRIFLTTWTPDLDFSWHTLILNLKILINAFPTPMLIKAEKINRFFSFIRTTVLLCFTFDLRSLPG